MPLCYHQEHTAAGTTSRKVDGVCCCMSQLSAQLRSGSSSLKLPDATKLYSEEAAQHPSPKHAGGLQVSFKDDITKVFLNFCRRQLFRKWCASLSNAGAQFPQRLRNRGNQTAATTATTNHSTCMHEILLDSLQSIRFLTILMACGASRVPVRRDHGLQVHMQPTDFHLRHTMWND